MIKAVVFDLDGTLLNTLNDLANAVNFGLESCSLPLRTVEEVRRFVGNGVRVLIKRAVPKGTDEVTYEKCFAIFREYYLQHMTDCTTVYAGIDELLEKLAEKGIKTAVVSNKLHAGVVGLCMDFFGSSLTCAFGVEKEEERKPAPANVYKALEKLGVAKNEAVYVGDSEVDAETAKNAGLDCIGVSWGFRDREELVQCGCKSVVDSCEQLLNLIINY